MNSLIFRKLYPINATKKKKQTSEVNLPSIAGLKGLNFAPFRHICSPKERKCPKLQKTCMFMKTAK